jgi:hypothetical protein
VQLPRQAADAMSCAASTNHKTQPGHADDHYISSTVWWNDLSSLSHIVLLMLCTMQCSKVPVTSDPCRWVLCYTSLSCSHTTTTLVHGLFLAVPCVSSRDYTSSLFTSKNEWKEWIKRYIRKYNYILYWTGFFIVQAMTSSTAIFSPYHDIPQPFYEISSPYPTPI